MKIVCAPDSFKESMTATQAAEAMARGIRQADPSTETICVPMADGGEGTIEAIIQALGGTVEHVACHDAMGRCSDGSIGWVPARRLAVVEVAQAVGIGCIDPAERNPERAASQGVADLVNRALDLGSQHIIIGLGGSATNDGGAGLLHGLGARLLDRDGRELDPRPVNSTDLCRLDLSGLDPRLHTVEFTIAGDVTNPLLGPNGATQVYGPQKGADPHMAARLEAWMKGWAEALETATGREVRNVEGAGAAGGIGAALLACSTATISPGVELVATTIGLDTIIAGADWVFTGEGSIDAQTSHGKTPWGVAQVARAHNVPTVMFGGRVTDGAVGLLDDIATAVVSLSTGPNDLAEALAAGPHNLALASRNVAAIITRTRQHSA